MTDSPILSDCLSYKLGVPKNGMPRPVFTQVCRGGALIHYPHLSKATLWLTLTVMKGAPEDVSILLGMGHKTLCYAVLSHFSRVRLFVTPWTVGDQASLSMGFSRQEYWSGLPLPPPGDLPNPGIESVSLSSPALTARFFTTSTTWDATRHCQGGIRTWCGFGSTL